MAGGRNGGGRGREGGESTVKIDKIIQLLKYPYIPKCYSVRCGNIEGEEEEVEEAW